MKRKKSIIFWVSFLICCCAGVVIFILNQKSIDLPIYIDPFDGSTLIEENEIPGGKQDIKTTTESSTRVENKKVKLQINQLTLKVEICFLIYQLIINAKYILW